MRRSRWVVAGGAAAVLVAAPWWGPAVLRPFRYFAVRRLEVVGVRYLAAEVVVGTLGLGARASIWTDLGALERRLLELPGVREAKVTRLVPATLRVMVWEVPPVALAAGPEALVPLASDGRPLPYDPASAPLDVPVVASAELPVLAALATVQATDPGLFAEISGAGPGAGREVVLDLADGRLRLPVPVEAEVVRAVVAVLRDLRARGQPWRELDARFGGWVVVRGPRGAGGAAA